ncbi:MAG: hypothetical protein KF745_06550 [Phycisphaeraceae bacterium]|nr:hypothetical protein [Phycisphaeraceae bacterium]
MTTWEPATEAEKQAIRHLLDQLRRAGIEPPPLPASALSASDLADLTRRDAGPLTTQLREALRDGQ